MTGHHAYTLYELNSQVRQAIGQAMPGTYWVEAELSEVRERTHCYMELVQNDAFGNTPVAKARALCWATHWQALRRKFAQQTGQTLQAGMKVLMQVSATFHEAYGFAYQVSDIDPGYTLGDIARKRMEIVRQLRDEGVFDLQRELSLPVFAQRVAVISSASAAGYGDFCHQIADNAYGLAFSITLFEATMQGEQVEQSIIAALDRINDCADDFDVVVIIRGGGATADMSGFDTLALAENVANFPLPIITGIGHDRDECVLDMVSFCRVKTPTAAATMLVDHLAEVYSALTEARERIAQAATRRLELERMRLMQVSGRIPTLFSLVKTRQAAQLQALDTRMAHAVSRLVDQQRYRLDLLGQRAYAQDPIHVLRRGYSITLCNGRAVRSPRQVMPGDTIETRVEQGTLTSKIIQ